MVKKLYIKETKAENEFPSGNVNMHVPHLFKCDKNDFDRLIDWCNDYLSQYGIDAHIQTTRAYNNELSLFYEIDDLNTTHHREIDTIISQAVRDFFEDNFNESISRKNRKLYIKETKTENDNLFVDNLIGLSHADAVETLEKKGYTLSEYGMVNGRTPKVDAVEYSLYVKGDSEIVIKYRLIADKINPRILNNGNIIDAYAY